MACSAAWRASPTSKKMRAFWKSWTPPGAASMWRAGPASASMTNCGVGRVTRARSPERDLDQPHLAQVQQRLAHRRPADAEMAHQLALGGKPVGFGEIAVADHPLEMLRDILGQSPLPDLSPTHLAYLLYQSSRPKTLGPNCQGSRPSIWRVRGSW